MINTPRKNIITNKEFDPKIHFAENKRVCRECGKVWHSLREREAKLNPSSNCCDQDTLGECGTCGTNSAQAQYRRNIQAREDTLSKLKQCPACGSNNCDLTILYHEREQ